MHASWLNQCEICFSIVQRKLLQPNNFTDLGTLEQALLGFGRRYEQIAQPFEWKFTRQDLDRVLDRVEQAHSRYPARKRRNGNTSRRPNVKELSGQRSRDQRARIKRRVVEYL